MPIYSNEWNDQLLDGDPSVDHHWLAFLSKGIPILSEEGNVIDRESRKLHSIGFWMDYLCSDYLLSDFTRDCKIDMEDFLKLSDEWLNTNDMPNWNSMYDIAPLERDGKIDNLDFQIMSYEWNK